MDAIVLVGGLGTRLRPLTLTRHKSLVPVLNEPAIVLLLRWLKAADIARVILALGQGQDDLAAAIPEGSQHAIPVVHVREHSRLESGGAIRNAIHAAAVEGRFVVLNGDIYPGFPLAGVLDAHERHRADLTLALVEVDDPSQFGVAVVDDQSLVTGFVEKPPPGEAPGNLVNAGVWVFEPGLVAEIPPGAVRVEETLFPSLVARCRRVLGYRAPGLWADLGTPERYLAISVALTHQQGGRVLAPDARVAPDATVEDTSIGAGTIVGARATIRRSILWEDVRVGEGAIIEDSILANGVVVGRGATLNGVVAGAGATIAPAGSVPTGDVIEPGGRYDGANGR